MSAKGRPKNGELVDQSVFDRFESKFVVEPNSGCWLWTASLNEGGYGRFRLGRAVKRAHRVAYELYRGGTASDLDHICRMRSCVNPSHLRPTTDLLNALNSTKTNAVKTHCPVGHEYTPGNTRLLKNLARSLGRFRRVCRTCERTYDHERRGR